MSPERWLSVCIDEGTQGKYPADPGRWDVFTARRAPQRQSLRGRFGQGWRRCALGTLGGGASGQVGQRPGEPQCSFDRGSVRFRGCCLCHLPDQSAGAFGEGVAFAEEGLSSEQLPPAAEGGSAGGTQTHTALPPLKASDSAPDRHSHRSLYCRCSVVALAGVRPPQGGTGEAVHPAFINRCLVPSPCPSWRLLGPPPGAACRGEGTETVTLQLRPKASGQERD